MEFFRPAAFMAVAATATIAHAQISPVTQERSVQTSASVTSGASDADSVDAPDFGSFIHSIQSSVTGAAGASALAAASQNSSISPTHLSADLGAISDVDTGSTFVVGESDGASRYLFIFSLAAETPVQFNALGQVVLQGSNPEGEPSDLYGRASVRLLDAVSLDQIAGLQINNVAGTDIAMFNGTLPAGQYAILASVETHGFSADLLGPPARTGIAQAAASFTLSAVPAPGASALLGIAALAVARRRRPG